MVKVHQLRDSRDFILDQVAKLHIVVLLLLLSPILLLNLLIVEVTQGYALLLLPLLPLLVFNFVLHGVIKDQDIPRIVGFRLDLAAGTRLDTCLGKVAEVDPGLGEGISCRNGHSGSIWRKVHLAMSDGRHQTLVHAFIRLYHRVVAAHGLA